MKQGTLYIIFWFLLERNGIDLEEFAAELNSRMTEEEIARRGGVVLLKPEHVNRGNH